jgi:hypothetical protein
VSFEIELYVCIFTDLHPHIKEEIIKLAENPDSGDVDSLVVPIDKVQPKSQKRPRNRPIKKQKRPMNFSIPERQSLTHLLFLSTSG